MNLTAQMANAAELRTWMAAGNRADAALLDRSLPDADGLDLVSDLNIPVLMDFPAGHEVPNLTLPFGTEVELVVEEVTGWLSYKEDALSTTEPVESAEEHPGGPPEAPPEGPPATDTALP